MKAGIETHPFFEKFEVQDTDADTLFEYVILLTLFNLVGIHLCGIEEGAVWPYTGILPYSHMGRNWELL